jgi:hypothetical protein
VIPGAHGRGDLREQNSAFARQAHITDDNANRDPSARSTGPTPTKEAFETEFDLSKKNQKSSGHIRVSRWSHIQWGC